MRRRWCAREKEIETMQQNPRSSVVSLVLLLGVTFSTLAHADTGIVTWVKPGKKDKLLDVQSTAMGVTAELFRTEANERIDSAEALRKAGWLISEGGLLETPEREAATEKIGFRVEGLPPGVHKVVLRFYAKPRGLGQQWWEFSKAGIDGGDKETAITANGEASAWGHGSSRLIEGLGGYEESVWEREVGTVGTAEEPATGLGVWFEKYTWTRQARLAAWRIETMPNMDYAQTRSPEDEAIREKILRNGPAGEKGQVAYGVQVLPASVKVRPKTFQLGAFGENISLADIEMRPGVVLAAARGEHESAQILVFSPRQPLEDVRLAASALTAEGGGTIPVEHTLFCPVGYVCFTRPYDLALHGWWPDPIHSYTDVLTVAQHDLQTLWFRVHVPRDAAPGTYTGTLSLTPGNGPAYEIPVSLEVWDFELPRMPNLPVVMGCRREVDFELDYGFNPGNIYGTLDAGDLKNAEEWAARGVTAINLTYVNPRELPSEEQMNEMLDTIGKQLEVLESFGLREAAYCYMFDEAKPDRWPVIRAVTKTLKERFPDLKLLTTSHDATFGVKSGLDAIDAWCPGLWHHDYAKAQQARTNGKEVWWYVCNSPMKPLPNLYLLNSAIDTRQLMGFMAFAMATDGFLYWSVLKDWKSGPVRGIYDPDYKLTGFLGDGNLYEQGPDGAMPSVRIEAMRDGLEDYDYLHLARERMEELKRQNISAPELGRQADEVRPLFSPGNHLVKSTTEYSQDPSELEGTRRRVAEYIVAASERLR